MRDFRVWVSRILRFRALGNLNFWGGGLVGSSRTGDWASKKRVRGFTLKYVVEDFGIVWEDLGLKVVVLGGLRVCAELSRLSQGSDLLWRVFET